MKQMQQVINQLVNTINMMLQNWTSSLIYFCLNERND
jgi:hypothetical protein